MSDELNYPHLKYMNWKFMMAFHKFKKSFTFLLNENFAINDKFILTRTKVHWINLQCCDKGLNKFSNTFSTKLHKYRISSVIKTTYVFQSWMKLKKRKVEWIYEWALDTLQNNFRKVHIKSHRELKTKFKDIAKK